MFSHHLFRSLKITAFTIGVLLAGLPLSGQGYLVVQDLVIKGNKWTRNYIIERELDIAAGDTVFLDKLVQQLEKNKDRLLNTGLFNQVDINLKDWDINKKIAVIQIDLVENWFWYPSPIIELGDRSFNEWIYQHNASLKRINLGIRFMHINLTGNQDKLKFNFNTGFTQKYEVDYTFPYLNKERTLGAYFNIMYVTHKEIAYETRDNKLNFIRLLNEDLLSRFRTSIGLNYRKNKEYYHSFILEFNRKVVHDSVSNTLNPYYFNEGKNTLQHFRLNYSFVYTNVDKKIYPTRGYRFLFNGRKDGGIVFNDLNYLQLTSAFEKWIQINDRYSIGAKIKGKKAINFGKPIPYSYLNGMGFFDDVLSGYQLYVIDGQDFAYIQTNQKIKLIDFEYNLGRYMPLRQFKVFPLQLFLGIHGDIGYVREDIFADINPFNNRLIYGAALSLDILFYHNYFFSWEFTINHLGETGVFLQGTNTFQ